MRILVAGIGNIFMGDDAFGCEVAAQLARRQWPDGVRIQDFGIRGYDLAYAMMDGHDATILIDAMPRGQPPGTLFLLQPDLAGLANLSAGPPDPHSMNPMTALQMVRTLGGEARGLRVVGCEPALLDTEEIGLSDPVRAAVPHAIAMVETLIQELFQTREQTPAIESTSAPRGTSRHAPAPSAAPR